MSKPPRKPREMARATDALDPSLATKPLTRRVDPRQADLFAPGFIPPCKPTLATRVPVGERWQYEIKHDGYRAQCHVREGVVQVFTKSGLDYADRLPATVRPCCATPAPWA